ncbi:MAG: DUF885 domain-containing protein [Lachnospiraceae bacterium]|nr:DUF885 domain-containing protein [Lachnospiraceae bacterium]
MSFQNKMTRKQWGICLTSLALTAALALFVLFFTNDTRKFRSFSRELFASELSGDTLSLHYTLAYPEEYGIKESPALPSYQAPSAENITYIQSLLDKLSHISPSRLTEDDAYTYDLLTRYLTLQLSGMAFPYYADPLSPSSGMQSSLPILLADYTFRSAKDVEDYLHLLDQTDTYFKQLVAYEQEKAEQGLFMSDAAAAKVIEQCTAIMDSEALSSGTHFLHTTFVERINTLLEKEIISKEQAEQWISENDRLLTTVMAPAYEETADAFTILSGSGQNEKGLYYYPKGQEYYQFLLASVTGTDRSLPEIKRMLFEDFQQNYLALFALLGKYPELSAVNSGEDLELPFESPKEMLEDLQNRMEEDFPPYPQSADDFYPVCTIKKVSSSMEEYSSPAYYLTPPMDDPETNIIYINQKSQPDSLSLYTTLAHEGYPGHLYQTVYSHLYFDEQDTSPIRSILHYGSYVEGWAYYVENLSYFYAQSIAEDQIQAAWYEACRLNRNLQLCIYSLLDIAIHYEGADLLQVQKILMRVGITSAETTRAIYEYIVEEPGNYLKYYLGFLEFLDLKSDAQTLWGELFTDRAFHQFILEAGPSDFRGLKQKLSASSANYFTQIRKEN